jgi:serine/threonine protein phosphatase PrpC
MAAAERQRNVEGADRERTATTVSPPARTQAVRRRTRLARGPLTIGEPAPAVRARVAAAEPYRPDTVADGGDAFGLTVRAASVRGLYKRYAGGARQDDLCLRLDPSTRTVIVAVADGVSAAPRSDLGAALAVRQAVAAVARQLERGMVKLDWGEVFRHAAWALLEEQRRTGGDPDAGVDEASAHLATTLIVTAISADPSALDEENDGGRHASDPDSFRVQVAAVGDSPAFVLAEGRFEPVVGETASGDGLLSSGVRALPSDAVAVGEATSTLTPGSTLLICSDGLALPLADGTGDVGRILARELSSPPDIVDFARLLDFSRATYDDDRTLIAVWPERQK